MQPSAHFPTHDPPTDGRVDGPPNGLRRDLGDRITALILLGISVALLVTSIDYGLFNGTNPGPGLFPAIVAGALVVLSVLWLITGAGAIRRDGTNPALADEDDDDAEIDAAGWRRIVYVVAMTLVPLLLLEPLGYFVAMTIYLTGLLTINARIKPWIALTVSLLGAGVTLIGADALGVSLPTPLGLLNLIGR